MPQTFKDRKMPGGTDSNWFKNNTKAMSTSYDSGEDILGGLEDIFFHFAQCLSLDSWRKKVARKSCDHSFDPEHGRGPLAASFPCRLCCKSDEQETLIFSSHLQLCTWALEVMSPLWELQPSILLPPTPCNIILKHSLPNAIPLLKPIYFFTVGVNCSVFHSSQVIEKIRCSFC